MPRFLGHDIVSLTTHVFAGFRVIRNHVYDLRQSILSENRCAMDFGTQRSILGTVCMRQKRVPCDLQQPIQF